MSEYTKSFDETKYRLLMIEEKKLSQLYDKKRNKISNKIQT